MLWRPGRGVLAPLTPVPAPQRRSQMAKGGKAPMAADEGYCVKCKAKRKISNGQQVKMANGRPALKGVCPVCGTGMFKILPPKLARKTPKPRPPVSATGGSCVAGVRNALWENAPRAVPLIGISERDAGHTHVLAVVRQQFELRILPARSAYAVHVALGREEVGEHVVVVPLAHARIGGVRAERVPEIAVSRQLRDRVERHRAEVDDPSRRRGDEVKPTEGQVPRTRVDRGVAPEVEGAPAAGRRRVERIGGGPD